MDALTNPGTSENVVLDSEQRAKPEVGRLQSAGAMPSLTILESAVYASGPTTGPSFSIF